MALAKIKDDVDYHYTVVGDGDDRSRLEALCFDLGLQDRTRFLGRVPYERMVSCLDETDLFVLAPQSTDRDMEGFGIVYAEAAARGVPSLLSAAGPVDTVQDGRTGIIIAEPTPDHIAAGILRFVREREKFDAAAIRTFAERFRWSAIAAQMWPIIESYVAGDRKAVSA
jgi:glycosyltransferase involved in cell wall biosynthesis